jgi:hypothetical protein
MKVGTISLDGFEEIAQWLDGQHVQFEKGVVKVHRKSVLEILIYWLRVCPVLTGRLRGSLTLYLDKWGKQGAYMKYIKDRALVTGGRTTDTPEDKKLESQDLVNEGKNEGLMVESDSQLLTTVGTNVVYAAAVDRKTQHFTKALVRGDVIYNKNFQNYLDAAAAKGWIPQEAEVSDEPDDGQVQG